MAFINPADIDKIHDALISGDEIARAIAIGIVTAAKDGRADGALLAKAHDLYGSDDIEIDDVAGTSAADNGTWVQAWVWVPMEEEDEEEEDFADE